MNKTIKQILEFELERIITRKLDLNNEIEAQRNVLKACEEYLAFLEQREAEIKAFIESELTL